MRIKFNFTPRFGYNLRDKLFDLLNNEDFFKYLSHMVDKEVVMELKPAVKKGTKQALYDYYHGPFMAIAIQAYTQAGYEGMDEVKCDYLLKAEVAKGAMTTPEGEQVYLLDKSKMTKERLIKFVNDCIDHLVINLDVPQENIPDSEMYKNMMNTGRAFKSVRNIKK